VGGRNIGSKLVGSFVSQINPKRRPGKKRKAEIRINLWDESSKYVVVSCVEDQILMKVLQKFCNSII